MAIETRQVTEGYAETVEYIRRLCEGEDVSSDKQTEVNGTVNGSTTNGTADGSANDVDSRASAGSPASSMSPKRKATIVHSPPRANNLNGAAGSPSTVFAASQTKKGTATLRSRTKASERDGKSHDTCDACGQPGQFVLCDRCPRVFHFLCAEPPVAFESLATLDKWFCRECTFRESRKRKSRAHAKNILYPLISSIESSNPKAFSVPEEIRRQFDGIDADADGTFVNTREERAQRVNGGDANRDFTRLTTDHGDTILCYRCGLSALHGPIVRCDYCPLSWHWDCLDPPLSGPPPPLKRWMCPNHADHALRRRHNRFRKERVIDLTDAPDDARNSGIIDVVDDEPPVELADPKVKFRVPATLIRRQFEQRAQRDRQRVFDLTAVEAQGSGSADNSCQSAMEEVASSDTMPSISASTSQESTGGSGSSKLGSSQSAVSLAEWLQSIVSFQQDVAQFVMSTAARAVMRESGDPCKTRVDKMQMLSDIAANVLDRPTAVSAARNVHVTPKTENGSAHALLDLSCGANSTERSADMHKDTTKDPARTGSSSSSSSSSSSKLVQFLERHKLERQDLRQALDSILNPTDLDSEQSATAAADVDNDVGAAAQSANINGNVLHRTKSPQPSTTGDGRFDVKRPRAESDSGERADPTALCSESEVNGAKRPRMQLRLKRDPESRSRHGDQATNAAALVRTLLAERGSDAIIDFLFSS